MSPHLPTSLKSRAATPMSVAAAPQTYAEALLKQLAQPPVPPASVEPRHSNVKTTLLDVDRQKIAQPVGSAADDDGAVDKPKSSVLGALLKDASGNQIGRKQFDTSLLSFDTDDAPPESVVLLAPGEAVAILPRPSATFMNLPTGQAEHLAGETPASALNSPTPDGHKTDVEAPHANIAAGFSPINQVEQVNSASPHVLSLEPPARSITSATNLRAQQPVQAIVPPPANHGILPAEMIADSQVPPPMDRPAAIGYQTSTDCNSGKPELSAPSSEDKGREQTASKMAKAPLPFDLFEASVVVHPPGFSPDTTNTHKLSPALPMDNKKEIAGSQLAPSGAAAEQSSFDPAPAQAHSSQKVFESNEGRSDAAFAGLPSFTPPSSMQTFSTEQSSEDFFGNNPQPSAGGGWQPPHRAIFEPEMPGTGKATKEQVLDAQGLAKEMSGTKGKLPRAREIAAPEPVADNLPQWQKYAACAAVALIVLVAACFNLRGQFFKTQTSVVKPVVRPVATTQSTSGTWEIAYQGDYEQKIHAGQMRLRQTGTDITGDGRDEAIFVVNGQFFPGEGTVIPAKIVLTKQYVVANQPRGKPIKCEGVVAFPYGQPAGMEGNFTAYRETGPFNARQLEEIHGRWQAQKTDESPRKASAPDGQADSMQPKAQPNIAPELSPETPAAQGPDWAKMAMTASLFLLFLGVGLVLLSLKLFGPSGLINVWTKKEYIPSQFKSQHKKMLNELGRPYRPGGLPLGLREDWNVTKIGEPKELHMPPEMREQNPHMLVMGSGAKGKSRLLANMITSDIESSDRAVVVVDSDGHLVDLLLRWMSAHPKGADISKRVIVIDPVSPNGCASYNPLELPEDGDYQSAASAIVYGFKAIYTEPPGAQSQWNQQTANILRNAALLLMANGKTLTDLPLLLSDNDFRDVLLDSIEKRKNERIEFITLIDQWSNYKKLARTDQWITWTEPILNRVTPMLGDPRIRPILTKPASDLSLHQVIAGAQILLVKIPQGQLDQNGLLLGSLLITGLKQAALSLSNQSTKAHWTALYIDEFDNFVDKETFDALTSETRKFHIGMTASLKTIQYLPEEFRNQLIINVGSVCAFSLAKKDADLLGPQMFRVDGRKVKHQTIQNLFNQVNSSPQFELISDEEKLNIDRLVGQEERTYFCYRVGTIAGVFHMKAHEFKDIQDSAINFALIDQVYANKSLRR